MPITNFARITRGKPRNGSGVELSVERRVTGLEIHFNNVRKTTQTSAGKGSFVQYNETSRVPTNVGRNIRDHMWYVSTNTLR